MALLLKSISLDLSTTGGVCSLDFVIGFSGLLSECEVADDAGDVVAVDGAGSFAFSVVAVDGAVSTVFSVAVVVSAVAVDELLLD